MDRKYTILIVDDILENIQYLDKVLKNDYEIRASSSAILSLQSAKLIKPDLILLDINLPQIDGYEVCRLIKQEKSLEDIPIIFISSYDDVEHKVKAFDNGGVDYITKPFEPREVQSRVKTQLQIAQDKKTITNLLNQQDLFIKKIMHEMNTPLSIISLNTDCAEKDIGPKKEFDSIKASVKILSSIYGDLSYMIKKESRKYELELINLVEFIPKRIVFFDEMASIKDIMIEFECDCEFSLNINQYELERIVDNTLSNAIKYSNPKTLISVCIKKQDKSYFLTIKDEGVGIDENIDLFAPYVQQSSSNQGLGLGLNIVKEICDKYNIKIVVSKNKDVGTTFGYDLTSVIGGAV